MVICLEQGADLHMAQLTPLPLTVSCLVKSRLVLSFWYWLTRVVLEKGPLNGCVCSFVRARRKHLEGEVFEMLLTFTDFLAFKELIVDYKAVSRSFHNSYELTTIVTMLARCL